LPASPPYPPNTLYRCSFGLEHWDDVTTYVFKVQMVYDGRVTGRKSPSYPAENDDLEKVLDAIRKLKKGGGKKIRGMIHPVGGENF